MSAIKKAAAKSLAAHLAAQIPAFGGRVYAGQQGVEVAVDLLPCAAVLPGRLTLNPLQADDVNTDSAGTVVQEVGSLGGTFELRVYARTPVERAKLEDSITNLFLATPFAPGVVKLTTAALTIGGAVTLYAAPIAFRMETEEWKEEFVFESRRFSFLDVGVDLPALVVREAYTMEEVYSAITEDLTSDTPEEEVRVYEDGSVTPTPVAPPAFDLLADIPWYGLWMADRGVATTDGSKVIAVADQSGRFGAAVQPNASYMPPLISGAMPSGRPAFRYTGGQCLYRLAPAILDFSEFTLWVAWKRATPTALRVAMTVGYFAGVNSADNARMALMHTDGNPNRYVQLYNINGAGLYTDWAANPWVNGVWESQIITRRAGVTRWFVNGVEQVVTHPTDTIVGGKPQLGIVSLGSWDTVVGMSAFADFGAWGISRSGLTDTQIANLSTWAEDWIGL